MTDVMVDLETLGVLPNAAIATLGAVKFHRSGRLQTLDQSDHFYRRIIIQTSLDAGLSTSPETEEWWNQQDPAIRHEAFGHEDRIPLTQALTEFADWYRGSRRIWGHGDDFDCVILASAYRACELEAPWNFWETRDTRTLFELAGVTMRDLPANDAHHALHDAYRQVVGAKRSLGILR